MTVTVKAVYATSAQHPRTRVQVVEPEATHLIGLVASDRDPLLPLTRALLDVAQELDITGEIERLIAATGRA